jgi:cyanophycinase
MALDGKPKASKKKKTKRAVKKGTLIIIGGSEDKTDEMTILKEIANQTGNGKLVVATIASQIPFEVWEIYKEIFTALGVKEVVHFSIEQHEQALKAENLNLFDDAKTVFFTGGDQLKITTKIGGTPIFEAIKDIYCNGGLIAGTSAGAAAMGKTMLVGKENVVESHKVGNWMMAPGLGLVEDILIDQHFAQRGRIGRLLGAVALNPGILGVGIDEDTSIIVNDDTFRVLGSSAIYVIDGRHVSFTNVAQAAADKTMSMHDVRLHIMGNSEKFNIKTRAPFF